MQANPMESIALRKGIPSTDFLRQWIGVLKPSELEFVQQRLGGLFHLVKMEIDWFLLQHLIARWDPESYTFKFGALELAPLYEEYGNLTALPRRSGILPLPYDDEPKKYIVRLLQISPATVSSLFTTEGHINVKELFKLRLTPYDPDMGDGQGSARAFILLFAGTILYPYTEGSLNKRTVYLAKAILEREPFLPNLIGQTNYSLTKIARKAKMGVRNHNFTFSPTLLQAWFYTHVGITGESFKKEQFPYLLERISDRARLPTRTFAGAKALFRSLEPEDFYPMAKCFDNDWAITSSPDGDYIPIIGFTGTSYYCPARVMHQFGGTPRIRAAPTQPFDPINLDEPPPRGVIRRSMAHIARVWMLLTEEEFKPLLEIQEDIDARSARFQKKRVTPWDRI